MKKEGEEMLWKLLPIDITRNLIKNNITELHAIFLILYYKTYNRFVKMKIYLVIILSAFIAKS
jgi:hypothetical protein